MSKNLCYSIQFISSAQFSVRVGVFFHAQRRYSGRVVPRSGMLLSTASAEETNDQTRSTLMEFEVAHSFPEGRVLASYPLPQGTLQSAMRAFAKFFAPPLSQVAHPTWFLHRPPPPPSC